MAVENGVWIMRGVSESDPSCLHSVEELEAYVDTAGFLPLFQTEIPGFSVEEHSVPSYWWSGDPNMDPWEWRAQAARRGHVAYGKFFGGKAGFISREWLPVFANFRRDGYDFDALWDEGRASRRAKKIMDLFMTDSEDGPVPGDAELFSFEIKKAAGFGKDGEANFAGVLTELQMQTYLVVRDFCQRKNKKGASYGMAAGIYCPPEHIFGADAVRACYSEEPEASAARIEEQVRKLYGPVSRKALGKILGIRKKSL